MKNIDTSMGTSTSRDETTIKHYIRFSADFENQGDALAFHMELLQCIARFQNPATSLEEEMKSILKGK
jgi:hypothetical protein